MITRSDLVQKYENTVTCGDWALLPDAAGPCPRCELRRLLAVFDRQEEAKLDTGLWMYLNDCTGNGMVMHLDTGKTLNSRDYKVKGECGMRRQLLTRKNKVFTELAEFAPLTPELYERMAPHAYDVNQWNHDPLCLPLEQVSDTPEWQAETRAKVEAALAHMPYDVQVLAIQLRHLIYYSDGNYATQQRFLRLAPAVEPSETWTKDWKLNPRLTKGATLDEVREYQAKKNLDTNRIAQGKVGLSDVAPVLWEGPAIAIRVLIDGQQPAFQGCRVYLDPVDLRFICSDWCQRSGRDMYEKGIDLQVREYDLATWLMGPCIGNAMRKGVFKPKSSTHRVVQMASVPKAAPVPSFEEVLKRHESAVNRLLRDYDVEETLSILRALLHPAEPPMTSAAHKERRLNLHRVPMRLIDKFSDAAREAYVNAMSDARVEAPNDSIGLTGYTKAESVYVRAQYLEIDEARVRERAAALALAQTPAPPATPVVPAEALTAEELAAKFMLACGVTAG